MIFRDRVNIFFNYYIQLNKRKNTFIYFLMVHKACFPLGITSEYSILFFSDGRQRRVDPKEKGDVGAQRGEGGETVVIMNCMREESISNKNSKKYYIQLNKRMNTFIFLMAHKTCYPLGLTSEYSTLHIASEIIAEIRAADLCVVQ